MHSIASREDGTHSIASREDGTHSIASREDGAHSIASREDGTHSIASREDGTHSIVSREDGTHSLVVVDDGTPVLSNEARPRGSTIDNLQCIHFGVLSSHELDLHSYVLPFGLRAQVSPLGVHIEEVPAINRGKTQSEPNTQTSYPDGPYL